MVFGTLSLPPASAGQVPAMVIAHGGDGVTDVRDFWWAEHFLSMGVAAFVVDSFTPRNVRVTATKHAELTAGADMAYTPIPLRLVGCDARHCARRTRIVVLQQAEPCAVR